MSSVGPYFLSWYSGKTCVKALIIFNVAFGCVAAVLDVNSSSRGSDRIASIDICVRLLPPSTAFPTWSYPPLYSQPWDFHKEGASKCSDGWFWYAYFYLNDELFQGRNPVIFPRWALVWNLEWMLLNEWRTPSPAYPWKQKKHGPSHSSMSLPWSWQSQFFCRFYCFLHWKPMITCGYLGWPLPVSALNVLCPGIPVTPRQAGMLATLRQLPSSLIFSSFSYDKVGHGLDST